MKDFLVKWWAQVHDDYKDYDQLITATSKENAIKIVSSQLGWIYRAGKDWSAREVEILDYETKEWKYKN